MGSFDNKVALVTGAGTNTGVIWSFVPNIAGATVGPAAGPDAGAVATLLRDRADTLVAMADLVVGIPMYGINNSFPVTVAAGIAMAEWTRRHYVTHALKGLP